MTDVSIRDLRNHGGDIVDRVTGGEEVTVTRDGKPVAELKPVRRPLLTAEALITRWRHLPAVDPRLLRADVDTTIDQGL